MADDYCDLCDLPKSTCVHGMPPPPPPAAPAARPARKAPVKRTAPVTTAARAVPRKWTPPEALQPHILEVLREAGGQLPVDDLFLELEAKLEGSLRPGDHETTPEGELRWRYAARRARQAMITEGLMTKGASGVWQLTDTGMSAS